LQKYLHFNSGSKKKHEPRMKTNITKYSQVLRIYCYNQIWRQRQFICKQQHQ